MTSKLLTAAIVLVALRTSGQGSLLTYNDGISHHQNHPSGISIDTRIVLERDGERVKIIFWQETENGFIFKNISWKGAVELLLDNGETLTLTEQVSKGHLMQPGGLVAGVQVPDLYQRYAAYYLSEQHCAKLKNHRVALVSYYVDDSFEKNMQYMDVNDSKNALKAQLVAIGK